MRGKGSVRIWSLPDGQPVWSSIHTNIIPRAEWSPDGTRILAACADGHARLWQFHTNQGPVRVSLELDLEHPAEVRTAGFHPSGNLFATGSRDGRFRLWDTHTGQLVREFDNAQETSNFAFYARRWDLAFSPDGSRLLGGNDYRARMWSLDSGTNRFDLALQGMLSSLRFSPDGESIITTDLGGVVILWSAATGQARATIPGYDHQESLAEDLGANFTPDGKGVGFWNHGGIEFRNLDSLRPASPRIPTRQITSAQHSRDGRRLLLGTASGRVEVWNLLIPETTSRVFELGTIGTGVLFSRDGRRLVTGNWSSQVGFWDAESGRSLVPEFRQQRAATYGIHSLAPSPDGQRVLATDWGGTARLYEIETGLPVSTLWTNTPGFPGVGAFLPNSNQVVTADRAGILRVHQLPDGACLRSVTNTEAMPFQQVLPTADGSLLYTVSNDGWGRCWDTATLTPHGKPFELGGPSRNARWSPDRRRILTLNAAEGSPRVWEAGTGQQLFELACPVTTSCGDFSPDNRWIATASVDGTVRLWDGHTCALRQQFQAGTRPLDLRFSNDGRWLAVGGTFGLRAWEVRTAEALTPLLELGSNDGYANGIAFSPDGWQLAGVGGGLGARTWNLRPLDYSRDQWRTLIAALTGQRVDANGELHEIPAPEQLALRDPACREFPAEFGASDLQTTEFLWARFTGQNHASTTERLGPLLDQAAAQDPPDNPATGYSRYRHLRSLFRLSRGDLAGAALDKPSLAIPRRDPDCTPHQINLEPAFKAGLGHGGFGAEGVFLGGLQAGLQSLGGIRFDVRGVVLLDGDNPGRGQRPASAEGIQVGVRGRTLHVLQGTSFEGPDGTSVGRIVVHYADGTRHDFPIVYGVDTRNWWTVSGEPGDTPKAQVVWRGNCPASLAQNSSLRLFLRSYPNPRPEILIDRLDIVSARNRPAPFIVAMTLE
jgi:WD40 repeat protein